MYFFCYSGDLEQVVFKVFICISIQIYFSSWKDGRCLLNKCSPAEFRICQLTHKLVSVSSGQHIHHRTAVKIKHIMWISFLFDWNLFDELSTTVLGFDWKLINITQISGSWMNVFMFLPAGSFNEGLRFWFEILIKQDLVANTGAKNKRVFVLVHPFPGVHYAACHPRRIKLSWFTFSLWTNTRQVWHKKNTYALANATLQVSPPSRTK